MALYEDSGLRSRAHKFGSPWRNFLWMLGFIGAVGILVYFLWATIEEAFFANVYINGVIVAVLVLGLFHALAQVLGVFSAVSWTQKFQSQSRVTDNLLDRAPYVVKPMAELMRETPSDTRISAAGARSMLDSVGARLSESGEVTRYFGRLLIFLGLLGTFWGLLLTLGGVVDVVNELAASAEGDGAIGALFGKLRTPLSGMAVAFSSSILGIAGSLVLGFLDLQANQAQNRFFNDLEDWLAKISRIGTAAGADGGSGAYAAALLEQTAESLDALTGTIKRSEESRTKANESISFLSSELAALNDRLARQQEALSVLRERAEDDSIARHVRNIDVTLQSLADGQAVEREGAFRELRTELRALAKTINAAIQQGKK